LHKDGLDSDIADCTNVQSGNADPREGSTLVKKESIQENQVFLDAHVSLIPKVRLTTILAKDTIGELCKGGEQRRLLGGCLSS